MMRIELLLAYGTACQITNIGMHVSLDVAKSPKSMPTSFRIRTYEKPVL